MKERFIVYIDQAVLGRFNDGIAARKFAKEIGKNYVANITVVDTFWEITWTESSTWF